MGPPVTAVLLAGTLRSTPLREALGVHVLQLPIGLNGTLFDAWMHALVEIENLRSVRIVVNSKREADDLAAAIASLERADGAAEIVTRAESASWRGAGGILSDATSDLEDDSIIIACEANMLPPPSLAPMVDHNEESTAGVVGVYGHDEPAGVYAFMRRTLNRVSSVGYQDLKEQFLPGLAASGVRIRTAPLDGRAFRLRDRKAYLNAVRSSITRESSDERPMRISAQAKIAEGAILDGICIVDDGVVIESGAVVHDAVILHGAVIGGGAVVSRSIVGPKVNVESEAKIIRMLVADDGQPAVTGRISSGHMRTMRGA